MPNKPPAGLNAKTGGIKHKYWLIGGAGVAVVGYVYYSRQSAANAATTTTDPTATDPTATDPGYDPNAGYNTGYGTNYGGAYGTPMPDPSLAQAAQAETDTATALGSIASTLAAPVETNQDWMHQAIKSLESHGYTYWQARHAVADYLAGAPLTQTQAHTVETAVGVIGPPPTTPPPIVISNPKNGNAGNSKSGRSSSGQSSKTSNKASQQHAAPVKKAKKPYPKGPWGRSLAPKKHKWHTA